MNGRGHDVHWFAPTPTWRSGHALGDAWRNGAVPRPAILRFSSDGFMEEFFRMLEQRPARLPEWLARPETWREPMPEPPTAAALAPLSTGTDEVDTEDDEEALPAEADDEILKLYQPAHERYYLASASLVCRQPGLPDRAVDPGKSERTFFVLRRLMHRTALDEFELDGPDVVEHAYVESGDGHAWLPIDAEDQETIRPGEEHLPLSRIAYVERGKRRRIHAGLIPVSRREAYLGAAFLDTSLKPTRGGPTDASAAVALTNVPTSPLGMLFVEQVLTPWKELVKLAARQERLANATSVLDPGDAAAQAEERVRIEVRLVEQIQTGSWYVLLDLAHFLQTHLTPVWDEIVSPTGALTGEALTLYQHLGDVSLSSSLVTRLAALEGSASFDKVTTLYEALRRVSAPATAGILESEGSAFTLDAEGEAAWPGFLFPLAFPDQSRRVPLPGRGTSNPWTDDVIDVALDALVPTMETALTEYRASFTGTRSPEPDLPPPIMPTLAQGEAYFVIRCVYDRPNCVPFHPAVVSARSQPFQMAPFFDPDAPARPVRISLPVDFSIAGLRKFKKNATFILSDMICGQIDAIRSYTFGDLVLSVLPWPFHKDLPRPESTKPCTKGGNSVGLWFSLSIPIVTLVALILLMVIVALLDTFFRWVPYLFVAFPIPGLKAKKS